MRRIYDERRLVMCRALDAMGLERTVGLRGRSTSTPTCRAPGLRASEFCVRLLEEAQVMIFPGSLFGDHTDDFLRISLLQPVTRIEEAVERMAETVAAVSGR